MKKFLTMARTVSRRLRFSELGFWATDIRQRLLKAYADWRVGARPSEMYNDNDAILLTFDDYGAPEQVDGLLRILDREQVRAVFFVQGDWAERSPELVTRITKAGHLIGNHTYSHADLLSLPEAEVRAEIKRGPASAWLRPPRGRFNGRVRVLAAGLGQSIKYWSIDSDDWQGVSADYMLRKILGQLHPRAVILFHIHGLHTPAVLPRLIQEIRRRGYRLAAKHEPIWGHK